RGTRRGSGGAVVVRAAFVLLLCACLPDPRGRCESDVDCAGGPAGLFCAEGVCQGPPRGAIDVPARTYARSETLHVRTRVEHAHGVATGRVVFGAMAIDGIREPDGAVA